MAAPVSAINFETIERVRSERETDSGVYNSSNGNSNVMPVYYGRNGNDDISSKRCCLIVTSKTPSRRLIKKGGKPNITRSNNPLRRIAYIRDIGNTLVNSRWKWTLLCFASSYVICWLVFAVLYMLVAGDNNDAASVNSACFNGVNDFAGYFLLSLETQQTIGYGTRLITSNCMEAVFLISLQMITSIAICGAMTTIVYTKMVRPRRWTHTTLFSKTAVICQRDGELCLIFRVRDDETKHGIATKINAYLVQTRMNDTCLRSLTLEKPGVLMWPIEVVHRITPDSPFWDLSAKDLITYRFELIVMMQGASITTGQCSKTRSSYLANEILWGHRFKPCVEYDSEKCAYYVDHTNFNRTQEVLTPLCSAQRLEEVVDEIASPLSTPMYYRSPTTSGRFYTSSQDDEESLGTSSSGIGSMRDEQLSPVLSTGGKKLSTIREINSSENIATVEPNLFEQSNPLLNTDKPKPKSTAKESEETPLDNSKSVNLDIEGLVASLQIYLDKSTNPKSNKFPCYETNL